VAVEKGFNLVKVLGLIGRQEALDLHVALALNAAWAGRLIMYRLTYMVLMRFHYNVLVEKFSA
jgi:hypothetical protein